MSRARWKALAGGAAVVVFLSPAAASAHEQRKVGAIEFTVGWQHEPTYAGSQNAIQLFLKDAGGQPIDDLGDPPTLQVQVITGNQTSDPLTLEPSFDEDTGLGTKGEFDAAIIPTRPGDYTFHFTGTVDGQKIDEKFTSSDTTFDAVHEPTAAEFPAKDPSIGDLATNLDRLNPRVDSAVTAAHSGKKAAASASDKASTAQTLGIVGIVLAVLLGGSGLLLGLKGRRRA
jgi:hypothetical protein